MVCLLRSHWRIGTHPRHWQTRNFLRSVGAAQLLPAGQQKGAWSIYHGTRSARFTCGAVVLALHWSRNGQCWGALRVSVVLVRVFLARTISSGQVGKDGPEVDHVGAGFQSIPWRSGPYMARDPRSACPRHDCNALAEAIMNTLAVLVWIIFIMCSSDYSIGCL